MYNFKTHLAYKKFLYLDFTKKDPSKRDKQFLFLSPLILEGTILQLKSSSFLKLALNSIIL